MRIIKIETSAHWVDWCNWLFVKIVTDEGLVGWGEASLHGALRSVVAAIEELGEHLIGQDPAGPEQHWTRLHNAWRWRGGAVYSTAMSALDQALWDIEGKRLGVPVHRLLGGAHRTRLRVYASHWLQGCDTPEKVAEGAREAVRRGFTAFMWSPLNGDKVHHDEAGEIRRAAERMAAAREAVGPDVDIFIECSERLSPRSAIALEDAFAPYRPGWFEEPLPFENADAMIALQKLLRTPIATGERLLNRFEFRRLIEQGGCRIIQPDIMHGGGFTELRKIAALADTYYIPVAPHNPGGPICTVASMHLAAAVPNFFILEQMEPQRALRDACSSVPIRFEGGCFILPETPGLGLEPNFEMLRELSFRPQPRAERSGALYR